LALESRPERRGGKKKQKEEARGNVPSEGASGLGGCGWGPEGLVEEETQKKDQPRNQKIEKMRVRGKGAKKRPSVKALLKKVH